MAEARGITTLLSRRGWTPTPAQERAHSPILSGRNLLLVAPTGSGKTEAALIPLIERCKGPGPPSIRILYITPLRALNRDLVTRLRTLADEHGLRTEVRHGDTPPAERRKQSLRPPDILLTTPESLQAMLLGRNLRAHLRSVKAVVVDEVHELAGNKRGAQLAVGLERLARVAGEFQRIGLSATAGTPERLAALLCGGRPCDVEVVPMARALTLAVVRPVASSVADLDLAGRLGVEADLAARLRWLAREIESHPGALVFTNTRQTAEVLGSRLKQMGASVEVHHGSLSAPVRVEAEERFRRGEVRALVCTSSLELGIDIGSVDFVVQYGSPRQVSRLVQRAGRSGHRPGAEARCAVVATDLDDLLECAVIARRAAAGELEPVEPIPQPLDVLANQLCAMLVEGVPKDEVPALLRRAEPFRDLGGETLGRVAESLQQAGLRPRGSARRYVVENLSMIPDEKKLELYDLARRKTVGSLDEAFVLKFSEPGSTVIVRGEAWRVVSIESGDPRKEKPGRVLVEPLPSLEGEVPHWEGEEILVPREVAEEVGAVRRRVADGLAAGNSDREAAEAVARDYPVSPAALEPLIATLREHAGAAPVPDDRTLLAEIGPRETTLHLCGGHRLNEAVGRAVATLLSARTGSSVALRAEPTRIHLTHPPKAPVRAVLKELRPEHAGLAERALRGTPLALWKTAHVARKFGLLARGALLDSRAARMWKGSPVEEEALRELARERLDIKGARRVLDDLASGRLALKFSGPTPLGRGPDRARELLLPERAVGSILKALEARILRDRVALACVACGKYRVVKTVASVEPKPECPKCGSRLLAALKPWEAPDPRHLGPPPRGAPPGPEPAGRKRLRRNANVVLSYGRDAVFALSARGVGPETAARILGKHTTGKVEREAMLRDLWEAERNYARTRSFWSEPEKVGSGRK
ncbi:MAG: DEAD/DEAH box helicase [Halobacteria archaeon]